MLQWQYLGARGRLGRGMARGGYGREERVTESLIIPTSKKKEKKKGKVLDRCRMVYVLILLC